MVNAAALTLARRASAAGGGRRVAPSPTTGRGATLNCKPAVTSAGVVSRLVAAATIGGNSACHAEAQSPQRQQAVPDHGAQAGGAEETVREVAHANGCNERLNADAGVASAGWSVADGGVLRMPIGGQTGKTPREV